MKNTSTMHRLAREQFPDLADLYTKFDHYSREFEAAMTSRALAACRASSVRHALWAAEQMLSVLDRIEEELTALRLRAERPPKPGITTDEAFGP